MLLDRYRDLVGDRAVNAIVEAAKPLSEKHIAHMNSAYYGGGVTEILSSMVPLMNDIGIYTGWRFLKGSPDFFIVTKKFHNALQGEKINFSAMKRRIYIDTNKTNASYTHVSEHDCVIVHDYQPLPMLSFYRKTQPWIWRCHVDLSKPYRPVWNYLKKFVVRYDSVVVSASQFKQKLPNPQHIIHPSIDPLTSKNIELGDRAISKYMKKFNIPTDKPIISQISRFDRWKDPTGVIDAFRLIRKKVDCRLVLLGDMASDDPEGHRVYEEVIKKAAKYDSDVILISHENNVLVNALQRASSVVIQKSLKEGFGLTVSEALWKGTPVVAGNTGGIPLQVIHGKTGYLVNNMKECANYTIKLLKNPKLAKKLGRHGREHVRKNFLITRHLMDWVNVLRKTFKYYAEKKY
jgi:trehalose synthase